MEQEVNNVRYMLLALLLIPAISIAAVSNYGPLEGSNPVVTALQGAQWGWVRKESSGSCENNPHTITFNAKLTEAVFQFQSPVHGADGKKSDRAVYSILARQGNTITMRIVGEKRLDPQGQPVVWDLLLVNERTYTWHRKDWPEKAYTPYLHKCN